MSESLKQLEGEVKKVTDTATKHDGIIKEVQVKVKTVEGDLGKVSQGSS